MSIDRPPFILAFIADHQGCAFHRIMAPLMSLVEAGLADGRIDMALWPEDLGKACKPDVVIWQRQVEDAQVDAMERWRKALPDALFIYELDDHLGAVPSASFHSSFMPPDIQPRLVRALAICDRTTTSTEPMADWLRSLGAKDVRVAPNALPQLRLREREPRRGGKLRVGFAGGMSHAGDLELLREAMTDIGDEVEWVFMGMQPVNPPVRVEFHHGVPVNMYLDAMAKLDLDLALAPLEDNEFNRCKSNLRLLEAGAISACVVVQDLPTYRTGDPPVFAYASSPADWTAAIRKFMGTTSAERGRNADALRSWVGRYHTLERRLSGRATVWLPDTDWKPSPAKESKARTVLCTGDVDTVSRMPFLRHLDVVHSGLADACRRARDVGADVLWLRPATTLTEDGWTLLRGALASGDDVAAAVPLAADGVDAFPEAIKWTPMPPDTAKLIDGIVRDLFHGKHTAVPVPCGPVVLLDRHALSMLGVPDVAGCDGNEEQALMEWGARAVTRRWKHVQAVGAYAASAAMPAAPTQQAVTRFQARGLGPALQTDFKGMAPAEREAIELRLLRSQWGGPRPGMIGFDNDYPSWIALRNVQQSKEIFRTNGMSWQELRFGEAPSGEVDWLIYTDESTTLSEDAAQRLVEAAAEQIHDGHDTRVAYADHESVVGKNRSPEFKPDFDLELFLAQDYVTPVCAVRSDVLDGRLPRDRIDLYTALLKQADQLGRLAFVHVPMILGSVAVDTSPETAALEALGRRVAIQEMYGDKVKIEPHRLIMGCLSVVRKWEGETPETPLVSIVVPTLGGGRLIQPCVATILQHTKYPNFEVIVVQNGERPEPELLSATRDDPHVRIVHYENPAKDGFNWSRINNWAIRTHARGSMIVTLNDDVSIASDHWLDAMVGHAVRPDVGLVGAKLVHPMGVLQHVGVVCHHGIAGHMHKGVPNGQAGHLGRAVLTHEASAATGACMLFRRQVFDVVGGFDESFAHNYGDTAFCLSIRKLGWRIVIEMAAELLHPEGTSRPNAFTAEGLRLLLEEGKAFAALCPGDDPFWSPNLAIGIVQGGLAIQGLNAEAFAWTDFRPRDTSKRVLLVNDLPGAEGLALDILAQGDVPMCADLSGFRLKLTAPLALNMRVMDVRDPGSVASTLQTLGVDRIVLRSLIGAAEAAPPVETLRAFDPGLFAQFGMQIEVRPVDPATIAPWLDPDVEHMEKGLRVFGAVDIAAWSAAYDSIEHYATSSLEAAQ